MEDHDAAAAEAARAQAEARRKRILEKANTRMGVVSGEQVLAEEDKKASESKAARIRAARQRRYGKKSVDPADGASKEEEPTGSDEPQSEPSKEPPQKVDDKGPEKEEEEQPDEPEAMETTADPGAPSSDEPKKKYVGVARMRRNMIKNKKKQEDSSGPEDSSPTATEISVDPKLVALEALKIPKVPVYMHILTILLLFFAGMDVSVQEYHHQMEVHSNFAVSQHGIPLLHRALRSPPSIETTKATLIQNLESLRADETPMMDEFQEDEAEDKIPNIDPLFGVDLDELTKGPGVVNQLARGAVAAHRSVLYLVYFLPLSIIQSLISIPQALLRSPPALCLIALALRHLVGKAILGASIADSSAGVEKSGSIDVLAMAKNFVTTFLNNNFPTAVGLYDAFTHLRSDMYVLLCGVFSGLVYVHLVASSASEPEIEVGMDVNDEL